jgi:ferric-dicitrate binding protein FerR (iron transport regulator)
VSTNYNDKYKVKEDKNIEDYLKWKSGSEEKPYDSENTVMIQELEAIMNAAELIEVPEMDQDKVFGRISKTLELETQEKKSTSKTFHLYRVLSGVAAIGLILISVLFLMDSSNNIIADQSIVSHTLPDNSVAILDKKSSIEYGNDFEEERTLTLKGEAFFEVEKGQTFMVKTKFGSVTVLGTSFNVSARSGVFDVMCKTGKVSVKTSSSEYVLTPGKSVRVSDEGVYQKDLQQVDKIGSWRNDIPHFESAPLVDVITKIEVHYDTSISLPDKYKDLSFTGSFVQNDINKALRMVLLSMDIEYTIDPNGNVIIK